MAANWKMNSLPADAVELAKAITDCNWPDILEVLVCPPFTHLESLTRLIPRSFSLGGQHCSDQSSGAFTGEISAAMLKALQCSYVILGHSERRARYPEETTRLTAAIKQAINSGLQVIYCCGEPLDIREKGLERDFVKRQLSQDLFDLEASKMENLVVAYEPVWAIGTGKNASPGQANEMHHWIRELLNKRFGPDSHAVRILYGGSVKASNAEALAAMPEIDGVLVGGASLIPEEFQGIIRAFS
ncbi:MAG TPA: triose-phosphate isomerase [Saprospiraceae bacterium]|nr:triose-phosphate isomerase [Saprospiraceae bacterium]